MVMVMVMTKMMKMMKMIDSNNSCDSVAGKLELEIDLLGGVSMNARSPHR